MRRPGAVRRRTDVTIHEPGDDGADPARDGGSGADSRPPDHPGRRTAVNVSTIRALGALTAIGGVTWGVAWLLSPSENGVNSQVEIWAGGVFQLGLLGLLAVMWQTAATGTSRLARSILAAEVVALILAMGWTVPYLFDANRPTTGILIVLDAFWPLSMVGFIAVGVMVARARRWPAPLRYLPLAASLLIPVDIAFAWAPEDVRTAVMAG